MKTAFLLLTGLVAAACSSSPSSPNSENRPKTPTTVALDKQAEQGTTVNYLCKDDEQIRVVRIKKSKKAKSKEVINLTFRNVTRKLAPAISESGKKYANIHWQWHEKGESGMLTSTFGDVLAEQCVPQQ